MQLRLIPHAIHGLGETSATILLARGEHPKIFPSVVSERRGHASISETLDRYSHVSRDMQQWAAHVDGLIGDPSRHEATRTA